jgi:hypothetical protein
VGLALSIRQRANTANGFRRIITSITRFWANINGFGTTLDTRRLRGRGRTMVSHYDNDLLGETTGCFAELVRKREGFGTSFKSCAR